MSHKIDFSQFPEAKLVFILFPRQVVTHVLDCIPTEMEYRAMEKVYRVRSGSRNQFTTYYAVDCTFD